MHRVVLSSFCAVAVLTACAEPPSTPPASTRLAPSFSLVGSSAAPGTGRHIVSFTSTAPADFQSRVQALGGTVDWVSSASGLATVSGLSSSAASSLAATSGIQEVDADAGIPLDLPAVSAAEAVDDAGVASNANPAGAVRYARQWNMRAVRADSAWAHGFLGSSSVRIYMLDTGIDYLHSDLVGRVDLTHSVDLLGSFLVADTAGDLHVFTEADTVHKYFPTRAAFTDLFFHGTHTGATVSSNAVRAAGITSGTQLVAVKVCAYLNICPFSSILNGVIYAADSGADVINMSLGGAFAKAGNGRFAGLIDKVFNYARGKGVLTVVSAGNAHANLDHDGDVYASFCDTPAVICVAATGPTSDANGTTRNGPWTDIDASAYYTNFGRSSINVAAPGGNSSFGPPLPSPATRDVFVWAACSQTSLLIGCSSSPNFILGAQGTSMSAPHVTGTAALLVSILGRNPGAIKSRIQNTADDLGAAGTDPFYGKGRLNVARAVGAIR
jgi:subtilisin family serine protease